MRAVEQAVAGVSASRACVLIFRNAQRNQNHVAHSRQFSRKHSVHAFFEGNLLLHDSCHHHDARLTAEILADVLHELDHAFASVDDPVRQNNRAPSGHVFLLELFRILSMVVHRCREGFENAASNLIATAHERDDERLAFVEQAVALRFALRS